MASQQASASPSNVFSPTVTIPVLALLGYLAFLATGFQWAGLSDTPSNTLILPIYLFSALLLLVLQVVISNNRSAGHVAYLLISAAAAIAFAVPAFVNHSHSTLFRQPTFYNVVEALIVVVFIYDAIARQVSPAPYSAAGRRPNRWWSVRRPVLGLVGGRRGRSVGAGIHRRGYPVTAGQSWIYDADSRQLCLREWGVVVPVR